MAAVPYNNSKESKKNQVEEMFDNISPRYDLLNHILSVNIDKVWRRRAIKKLSLFNPEFILDIATGTGDFAIAASKIEGAKTIGIDISEGMLKIARKKVQKKGLSERIKLQKADSESLPFEKNRFDAAVVGFGVRNFENLKLGLSEICRVLKPGGVFIILEFSKPQKSPFKQIYNFYFLNILPMLGRLISKDKRAYQYLPESVGEFPDGKDFLRILEEVGFTHCSWYPQTFGIASIYKVQKPEF
jgi:demethylmenaquinone methyltransferase/2-methoxy-6-polyprenyl-1,4-benzoquinol methylase